MKKTKAQTVNYEKALCLSLFALCIGLVALYMYFVSASIVHVVIRKEVSQDLVTLNSEISQLESQYIKSQHRVSDQIASLDGYTEVADKTFIDRTHVSLALSGSLGE